MVAPPAHRPVFSRYSPIVLRVLAAALALAATASLAFPHPGAWSPRSAEWDGTAVHMALLRGDGSPYHSRVIWWQEENVAGIIGGQWGWKSNAGTADCSIYPDAALIKLTLPDPATNIFCAGLTQTARGQLAVVGGTELGTENGMRTMKIFRAGGGDSSGTWTECDSMANWRYYPTATTLADGRVATFSGSKFFHIDFFGGRKNGETLPSSDDILRFGTGFKGVWEPSIPNPGLPAVWPKPLTGASGLRVPGYSNIVLFGGRDSSGTLQDATYALYRDFVEGNTDYSYTWIHFDPPDGFARPDPRMDHVAAVVDFDTSSSNVIVMGGLAKHPGVPEATTNDVWKHFQIVVDNSTQRKESRWKQITKIGGTPPSTRMGHSAVYDADHHRMLVFGGRPSPTADPTDNTVYALNFDTADADTAWWSIPTDQSVYGHPSPRFDHTMEFDAVSRKYAYEDSSFKSAILFGGHGDSTDTFNDTWKLWVYPNGDVAWEQASVAVGPKPPARSNHTAFYESGTARFFVFGGENASGLVDSTVWALDLDETPYAHWRPFAAPGYSLSGQVAAFDNIAYSLSPEVFTESTNSWEQNSYAHAQQWYPQMFQMKNGKVFQSGPSLLSYMFDPADGSWAGFPAADTCEIYGGGAVMYEPDKVMKCGARDTENGVTAVRTTQYLDLDAPSPEWVTCDSMAFGRVNHNLVLLPNGKVLMTGGLGVALDDHNIDPRLRPEIWDPTTHSWSILSDGDSLAASTVPRGYHSTAILLPDARVLCAGGNGTFPENHTEVTDGSQIHGDVFCPPYLFHSDGSLATRPILLSATGRWRYGQDVAFAVSGNTSVQDVCLIHACATTHAQDEAQRYIPLSVDNSAYANGARQYFLKAPPDSFTAPPGDYLLFVSDSVGVPSIAQWVRVGSEQDGQFDATAPDTLSLAAEFITCDGIYPITWAAPGDDGSSGIALDYDVRYSTSPITEVNFESATIFTGIPIPHLAGSVQGADDLTSLQTCTNYYFAGKTRDRAGNWSALGHAKYKTLCVGGNCGGLGAAMQRSRGEAGAGSRGTIAVGPNAASRPFASSAGQTATLSPVRLVGEFQSGETLRWTVRFEDLSDDPALLEATTSRLVVQASTPMGWQTRSTSSPHGGVMGVRSLRKSGRVVFPYGTALDAVELAPVGFECLTADHSRLGDLLSTSTSDLTSEFGSGDTVTCSFRASTTEGDGNDFFLRVLLPDLAATASARRQGAEGPGSPTGSDLPLSFALHPVQPNPFSHATTIRFDLPRSSEVRLEVFDVQGRRVATLLKGTQLPGRHSVEWNGLTDRGRRAPAGVYLCRMTAGTFTAERRMSLLP